VPQEEFVRIRQVDQTMNPERFRWEILLSRHERCNSSRICVSNGFYLSFCRLLALSYGQDSVTLEHWARARELDNQRLARLNQQPGNRT
jgi:hypothetical protein